MTAQNKKVAFGALSLSAGLWLFYIFACWYSVSQFGSATLLSGASLFVALFTGAVIVAMLFMIAKLLGILFRLTPSDYSKVSAVALLCGIYIPFMIFGFRTGDWIRYRGFRTIVANSQPLIQAIQHYKEKHGTFPENLDRLEPEFLKNVPETGVAAYPYYNLLLNGNLPAYNGNSWILTVPVSTDNTTFDILVYFPNQRYPEKYIDARIGDWVLIQMGGISAKQNGLAISN